MNDKEYLQLLDRYVHSKDCADPPSNLAKARRLLRSPAGRALVEKFPSVTEIRGGARRHLETTLRLNGMEIRLGLVTLSGVFQTLDAEFRAIRSMNMPEESQGHVLYLGFKISVAIATPVGTFRAEIYVDEDDDKGWQCRSYGLSRGEIERAVRRPARRIVVVTVVDQAVARRVALLVRPEAVRVKVWTQREWDRQIANQFLGAIHGPVKVRRLRKVRGRRGGRQQGRAFAPMVSPLCGAAR